MNARQRALVCKYLSDTSKGVLLAGVVGFFTGNVSGWLLVIHVIIAGYAFWAAYLLEGEQ